MLLGKLAAICRVADVGQHGDSAVALSAVATAFAARIVIGGTSTGVWKAVRSYAYSRKST